MKELSRTIAVALSGMAGLDRLEQGPLGAAVCRAAQLQPPAATLYDVAIQGRNDRAQDELRTSILHCLRSTF